MSNKLYLNQLSQAQKDDIIQQLLNILGVELVDSAEWGDPIPTLGPKNGKSEIVCTNGRKLDLQGLRHLIRNPQYDIERDIY